MGRLPFITSLVAAFLGGATIPALAEPFLLPASEFEKTPPSMTESLGSSAQFVADRQNIFEPMGQLREDATLRQATRAVGMLMMKVRRNGDEGLSVCTATLVEGGTAILTNYHCIPGLGGEVLEAALLLDYFSADSNIIRLGVATEARVGDADLDFAIVPLLDAAPRDIKPVVFAPGQVKPRERLLMVHHPAGKPKMMTQFGCTAHSSISQTTMLRHTCDTLGGSSGAPIFNDAYRVVGIHHHSGLTGIDPASFNRGTRISKILVKVPELAAGSTAADPSGGIAALGADKDGNSTVDQLNDLISGSD